MTPGAPSWLGEGLGRMILISSQGLVKYLGITVVGIAYETVRFFEYVVAGPHGSGLFVLHSPYI